MPTPTAFLVLLAALPQVEDAPGGAGGWQALPVPSIAAAPVLPPALPRILDGRHVLLPGRELRDARSGAGVHVPLPALMSLLQEDAGRRRAPLRLQPGAPPLLARGEPAALQSARELLQGLDRVGDSLDIQLSAWLTPGAADVGTHPDPAVFEAAVAGAERLGRARLRSGDAVVFGARRRHDFVAGYATQIASGSSVSGPSLGQVLSGRTLHLRACRVDRGRGVALEGLLDLADSGERARFDPGTPDLGLLEQPDVPSVQVAFAGRVESLGVLCISISGSPLAQADWTLWIRAATTPDGGGGSWRARELAWLEQEPGALPMPHPGVGFESVASTAAEMPPAPALSAASVAQVADAERGASGRGGRTPIVWSPGIVLAPADEAVLWNEVESLTEAAERERLRAATLVVRQGELRVVLPLLEGVPARVLVGRERTVVTGYELEVASETWMPRPVVESAFDGLLVQGRLTHGELMGAAWQATSATEPRELSRETVGLARIQPQDRSFVSASLRWAVGDGAGSVLEGGPSGAALEIELSAR